MASILTGGPVVASWLNTGAFQLGFLASPELLRGGLLLLGHTRSCHRGRRSPGFLVYPRMDVGWLVGWSFRLGTRLRLLLFGPVGLSLQPQLF